MSERLLIAFDGKAWHVRQIRLIEHDLVRDEKVYRCDKPLGNDFTSLKQAVTFVRRREKALADRERGADR